MSDQSDFEKHIEAIIFPGFPDDPDERLDIVARLRALVEASVPRACQSESHSPLACSFGSGERLWLCYACLRWFCYGEDFQTDAAGDLCGACGAKKTISVTTPSMSYMQKLEN